MRKLFFSCMMTCTLCLFSCSSNEEPAEFVQTQPANLEVVDSEAEAFSEVISELKTLNQQYVQPSGQTRAKWLKWAFVGLSDVFGAATWNVAGAGVTSATAYALLFKCDFKMVFHLFGGGTISCSSRTRSDAHPLYPDSIYTGVDANAGSYHNEIICNIFSDSIKLTNFLAADSLQRVQMTINEYNSIASGNMNPTNQQKGLIAFKSALLGELFDSSPNMKVFIAQVKANYNDLRIPPSEVDAIVEYMSGIYSAGKEHSKYMNQALRIVDNSNLSDTAKIKMQNNMIIGNASYKLIRDYGIDD